MTSTQRPLDRTMRDVPTPTNDRSPIGKPGTRPTRAVAAALVGTALFALAGCQTATPAADEPATTDRQFGASVREAMARQTIDPQAASKAGDPKGDAGTARTAMGRYQDSFKQPPKTFNVLGIGGVATGSER